jgi:hypothetical protein
MTPSQLEERMAALGTSAHLFGDWGQLVQFPNRRSAELRLGGPTISPYCERSVFRSRTHGNPGAMPGHMTAPLLSYSRRHRQRGAVADRTFAIRFLDPGVQAYAFTFG